VIASGIGKTGLIAQKFSATLASVGIPSFFIHAAEAFHGDLGRVERGDLAVLVSASGEAPELIRLTPYLHRAGCTIIAVTNNADSTLARHADLALATPKVQEAGPHHLAPTSSTVVLLGLLDAIAMTVLEQREFTPAHYAAFHPGGHLGFRLLTVDEVMRRGAQCCIVPATASCRATIQAISSTPGRPGAASIVNDEGVLVGVFTDGDLRRWLQGNESFLDRPISECMGKNPKSVLADQRADEALKILADYQIDQVIVVSAERRPIGIVDIQDLMSFGRELQNRQAPSPSPR
jgi:arabinose-5-phosphate isomerase